MVLVSGAAVWMGRYFSGALLALKTVSKLLHANRFGMLWLGLVSEKSVRQSAAEKKRVKNLMRKLLG